MVDEVGEGLKFKARLGSMTGVCTWAGVVVEEVGWVALAGKNSSSNTTCRDTKNSF